MHSRIRYICLFFLHCVFSYVSLKFLSERMHSHTDCIYLTFLHCEFSNVSSNCLSEKRQSHTGCICLAFLNCVFSNVSSNRMPEKRHSHIGCICLTFLRYVFSNGLPEMRQSHIDFGFSPLCVFICVLKLRVCENAKSLGYICLTFLHCMFSNVSWNGLPQRMHIASSHWLHLFDFSALCIFKC